MKKKGLSMDLPTKKLHGVTDGLILAVAVSLPWSTSATGIFIGFWLALSLAVLDFQSLRRILRTSAGGLPVLLVLLGVAGMFWADVTWFERLKGLASFSKLLLIPVLLSQFERSKRADWVFGGYLLSCVVLLLASYVWAFWPGTLAHFSDAYGVPVKNGPTQSGEFVTCVFGLTYIAYEASTEQQWRRFAACAALILVMLANITFVTNGRTALVVLLALLAVFAFKQLSARKVFMLFATTVAVAALTWFASPYLRHRTEQIWTDYQKYEMNNQRTSSGERVEFAKKSIEFIRAAPVIGYGTGSIHSVFSKASIGQTGAKGTATTNPHNQTFAVAIQLGILGAVVLWAMWLAHLRLFGGAGLAAWIGLVVVVQNIVGSLFNSHLFDFVQGWVYVIGVGVAGGVVLKNRLAAGPSDMTS